MTSLQNHFMTYHNSGHHKDVMTPNDLTTAKKGQNFYNFAFQSQIGGYFKTWRLENERLKERQKSTIKSYDFNHFNSMVVSPNFLFLVFLLEACIYFRQHFGISILESQNYFSHYGLEENLRKMVVMKESKHIIHGILII